MNETFTSLFQIVEREMRRLTTFEQCPIRFDINVQMALRFSSKNEVNEVAKILQEKAIGCRCASDGKNIYPLKEKVPIMEIPNFENLNKAAVFCSEKRRPKIQDGLACVCVNDDTVVLNSNHMCADGGQLIELNKYILGQETLPDKNLPTPIPLEYGVLDDLLVNSGVPNNNSTELIMDKTKWTVPSRESKASHTRFVADYTTLKSYDAKLKKVNRITDNFWSSIILSAFAYNNKTIDRFGTFTCVNMRPYIKNPTLDNADGFGKIAQTVAIPDPNESIGDVCKRFRKVFNDHTLDIFRNIKLFYVSEDLPKGAYENVGLELSNAGTFQAKGPIKDLYAGLSMEERVGLGEVCLLTYTIERDHTKECIGQVRYPSSRVSHHDAWMLSESMKYFLQNISLSEKVGDAVEKLYEFQKNFKYDPNVLLTTQL